MSEPPRPPSESFGSAPEEPRPPATPPAPPTPPAAPPPYAPPASTSPPPSAGGMPMGAPTPGYANSDEKTWALIAHFGGIVVGFIAPLVAFLAKGNESPTVRAHVVEALNFHITWGVAT